MIGKNTNKYWLFLLISLRNGLQNPLLCVGQSKSPLSRISQLILKIISIALKIPVKSIY